MSQGYEHTKEVEARIWAIARAACEARSGEGSWGDVYEVVSHFKRLWHDTVVVVLQAADAYDKGEIETDYGRKFISEDVGIST